MSSTEADEEVDNTKDHIRKKISNLKSIIRQLHFIVVVWIGNFTNVYNFCLFSDPKSSSKKGTSNNKATDKEIISPEDDLLCIDDQDEIRRINGFIYGDELLEDEAANAEREVEGTLNTSDTNQCRELSFETVGDQSVTAEETEFGLTVYTTEL